MSLSMAHPAPIKTTARSDRMDHEDGGRCGCDAGEKPPVMIAVMGVTGAGKSTFISTLTERDVEIGHDLTSCTSPQEVSLTHSCLESRPLELLQLLIHNLL